MMCLEHGKNGGNTISAGWHDALKGREKREAFTADDWQNLMDYASGRCFMEPPMVEDLTKRALIYINNHTDLLGT